MIKKNLLITFVLYLFVFSCSNNITNSNNDLTNCIDFDGNIYDTIIIGDQEWMIENFKVTHYRNGDPILNETNENTWIELSAGAYCIYNNDPSFIESYGCLYNWFAVNDLRGLAPEGWHIPTDQEIKELEMYLGMTEFSANNTGMRGTNEGSKLAGNRELWEDGELTDNVDFGISGLNLIPSGYRDSNSGDFIGSSDNVHFWSTSEQDSINTWLRYIYSYDSEVGRYFVNNKAGCSIRCIKD